MNDRALKNHFLHQFQHAHHADGQIIDALAALPAGAVPQRALKLLSHALRSQDVWLGRVRGEEDLPVLWQTDTLAACRARAENSADAWHSFLENCTPSDFAQVIHYENSKGRAFTNELREICAHVINHATHHRAQIASLLREAGGEPPATDYIFFARAQREA